MTSMSQDNNLRKHLAGLQEAHAVRVARHLEDREVEPATLVETDHLQQQIIGAGFLAVLSFGIGAVSLPVSVIALIFAWSFK